jgi:Na+-transporting methylmalonyl-CoA/oxaloacetate decarboxylase gamma subunit
VALVDVVAAAGGSPWILLALFVLLMLSEVIRRTLTYWAAIRRETEHTRRVEAAVAGTQSQHRAEVVMACTCLQSEFRRP